MCWDWVCIKKITLCQSSSAFLKTSEMKTTTTAFCSAFALRHVPFSNVSTKNCTPVTVVTTSLPTCSSSSFHGSFSGSPFRHHHRSNLHTVTQSRPPRCASTTTTKCMLPGNIEDVPLEPLPWSGTIPAHWRRPGVYGIYSDSSILQYVAASVDVGASIAGHMTTLRDATRAYAVRMMTFDDVNAAPLNELAKNWVMALHQAGLGVPPGNSDEAPEWRKEVDKTKQQSQTVYFKSDIPAPNVETRVKMEIQRILRENHVVLFMKGTHGAPKCGFSKQVVDIMNRNSPGNFVCVDCLDSVRNEGLREGIKTFSKWPTIPQLYIAGDFVGGADIVQEMEMNGELTAVLNS